MREWYTNAALTAIAALLAAQLATQHFHGPTDVHVLNRVSVSGEGLSGPVQVEIVGLGTLLNKQGGLPVRLCDHKDCASLTPRVEMLGGVSTTYWVLPVETTCGDRFRPCVVELKR